MRRKSRNTTCCAEVLAWLQKALKLSDAQLQDLLHVQHLVLIKESLLEMERKVEPLVRTEQVSFPLDSFAALEADSNRFKGNLLQIHKVRFQAGTAVFVGVSLPVFVSCLPYHKCEQQSNQVFEMYVNNVFALSALTSISMQHCTVQPPVCNFYQLVACICALQSADQMCCTHFADLDRQTTGPASGTLAFLSKAAYLAGDHQP